MMPELTVSVPGPATWRRAPALIIARFAWIEAVRSRWPWVLVGALMASLSLAVFAGEWALVERQSVQIALLAPILRWMAVLLVVLFTASSVSREFADRSIALLLAAPVSRQSWVSGRMLAASAVALCTSLLLSLPLLLWVPVGAWCNWTLSLLLETTLIGCAAVVVACVFRQLPVALVAVLAFYAASRLIGVMLLIAERAPYETSVMTNNIVSGFLRAVAALLPRLDRFTQTSWLLDPAMPALLAPVLAQSVLYVALIWVVALIDFRKADL